MTDQKKLPTPEETQALLDASDIFSLTLQRGRGFWQCAARGLHVQAVGGGQTAIEAIHAAVVNHNEEWQEEMDKIGTAHERR